MYYRVRPIVVDAVQWRGENLRQVIDFLGHFYHGLEDGDTIIVETFSGPRNVKRGDWLVRREGGCCIHDNDAFHCLYEMIGEPL